MAETQNITENAKPAAPKGRGGDRGGRGKDSRGRGGRRRREDREPPEFEQKILDLARVTRVTKGGKRMRFRTCLVIGDKKGRVGIGLAKGHDVSASIEKAFRQAQKNLVTVPMDGTTIPHEALHKFGAAAVMLKPASEGSGLKSGGAVRMVLEFAGIKDVTSKIVGGSKNKVNIARATIKALQSLNSAK